MNLSDVLSALPQVLIAAAVLVTAIRGFRRLETKVGGVHIVAEQVNKAVNNVGAGEPTLRTVVVQISQRLDDHIVESSSRLDRIEEHLTQPIKKPRSTEKKSTSSAAVDTPSTAPRRRSGGKTG